MKFFIIEFILFKIDNLYSGSVLDLLFKNDQKFSPILKNGENELQKVVLPDHYLSGKNSE